LAEIRLIRHGQARLDQENYDQLSELGILQSEVLGRWLAATRRQPGRVVCGTLDRHRQTATACLAAWGQTASPPAQDARLNEFDHQEVLARCWPELTEPGTLKTVLATAENPRRKFRELFLASVERWISGRYDSDYTETWESFRFRCVAGLEAAVNGRKPSGDLSIFTSGGPIAAICQHILGLSDAKAIELNWSTLNTGLTIVANGRRGLRLASFNSVAHLDASGNADLITYR
jgi:broad specificity phosphatase PhoE